MADQKPRVGLTLAAGGAKGVAYIPILRALEDLGVEISAICGSSVGSLIGGWYAAGGSPDAMEAVLNRFGPTTLGEFFSLNWGGAGLISGKSVRSFLEKHLPVHSFEQTRIPFVAVATDYWRRKPLVFRSGSLIDAIQASAAVPGLFEPVVLNDTLLVDGGIANTLPYDYIRDQTDFMIGVHVSNRLEEPDTSKVPGMPEMLMNTYRILTDRLSDLELKNDPIDLYTRLVLPDVEILDFHKYREVFDQVAPEIERFREQLKEKLSL